MVFLPPFEPSFRSDDVWNFQTLNVAPGAKVHITGGATHVAYASGKSSSSSGMSAHASPPSVFPCNDATFEYKLYLGRDFQPVMGGKLAGLYIGSAGASGGQWLDDAGSMRIVFKPRKDGGTCALGYMYLPLQAFGGSREQVKRSLQRFGSTLSVTEKGIHVWRDGVGPLYKNRWNDIRLRLKLNTPGSSDGVLEMTVNGTTQRLDGLVWRSSSNLKIEGICMSCFYGGSGPECNAPPKSHILLKDIQCTSDKPVKSLPKPSIRIS